MWRDMIAPMNIDTFTAAALVDEFRQTIEGGRVQQIVQISPQSFGLEIYNHRQRFNLLLAADPQSPRAYLQSQKARRGTGNETPLFQLCRKYVDSSFLQSIEQPPMERVLRFHFSNKVGQTSLVLELLGTRSNLIFVDEAERILGLVKPVPSQPNRRRVLLPNQTYTLPQAQNKLSADTLTIEVLQSIVDRAPEDNLLSKTLVTRLAGLSPLIAREIVYRAYQDAEIKISYVPDLSLLLDAVKSAYAPFKSHEWQPHVAFDEDETVEYFAPLALTHLPHSEPSESMSRAVEAHLTRTTVATTDSYHTARFPVHLAIEQAQKRISRRLKELEKDAAKLEDPEVFKNKGEAILAFNYQIERRQTELEVVWPEDKPLKISLDPTLSAPENAQRYFARYQKAKRAANIIPKQRRSAEHELEFLSQLSLDLEMAEVRPDIDAVAAALENAGFGKSFKQQVKKTVKKKAVPAASQPRRFISPDGYVVLVGRNATQNHALTFGQARPDDIWLHARGVPGSHVVISSPDDPPKSTIEWAASIAAFYSKAKKAGRAVVSYTRKKHVRPIKGAPPGLVRLRNESTIQVRPFKPEEA